MGHRIHQLTADDLVLMDGLLTTFGEVFGQPETYTGNSPDAAYMRQLLESDGFIALVALKGGAVVGGLAAYELKKFERPRSEIYIYDLAVAEAHRRQGVATALIERVKQIAVQRGVHAVFVQADTEEEDQAAIALYSKLGSREDVLHFDITLDEGGN
nr:AAC(3)-I family aminoglycoside N-acetyltransferase [Halomonas socia]